MPDAPEDAAVLGPYDRETPDGLQARVIPLFPRVAQQDSAVVAAEPGLPRARPWPDAARARVLAARGRRFLNETRSLRGGEDGGSVGR